VDLLAVMTECTGRLEGLGGIRSFPTPPESAPAPFACCGAPETSSLRVTSNVLGNGLIRLTLPLMVAVAGVSDRNVWADMLGFASTTGPKSVINALEQPDEYVAFDTLAVNGWETANVTVADVQLLAVTFNLDIHGR
jgi:hypothetical protein